MARKLRMRWTTSAEAGGCNFCSRYIDRAGEALHDVLEVGGGDRTTVVRFCRACKAQLDAKVFDGRRP